jgi:hypothetical protein
MIVIKPPYDDIKIRTGEWRQLKHQQAPMYKKTVYHKNGTSRSCIQTPLLRTFGLRTIKNNNNKNYKLPLLINLDTKYDVLSEYLHHYFTDIIKEYITEYTGEHKLLKKMLELDKSLREGSLSIPDKKYYSFLTKNSYSGGYIINVKITYCPAHQGNPPDLITTLGQISSFGELDSKLDYLNYQCTIKALLVFDYIWKNDDKYGLVVRAAAILTSNTQ